MNEATMSMSGRVTVSGNGSAAEDSFKITASAPICNGSGSVTLTAKPNYRPRCANSRTASFRQLFRSFLVTRILCDASRKTQTRDVASGLNDAKLFVCIVSGLFTPFVRRDDVVSVTDLQ
jgi:hypothetical protein